MERSRNKHSSSKLLWATLAALLTQNLVIPVASSTTFDDRKTYYSPDPRTPTTPPSSHSPPSHGHRPPTPSHGPPSHCGGTPPPSNCGCPPSGGHHHPTPSPPSGGYYDPPPSSTPTTPTTPTPITPTPTTPTPYTPTPTTPTPYTPTPTTPTPYTPTPTIVSPPTIFTPPTTPIDPGTGTPTIPSPPYAFDPNSPPFTCDYWRTHPGLIWGLLGWFGTVGGAFGVASLPGLGSNTNLVQALSNTRADGLGSLYREGTAALLNSMVHKGFPYTTRQVRDSFAAALGSNKEAAAQAKLFKQANEGKAKPRA